MDSFIQYSRRLPHWQAAGKTHFLTWHCVQSLTLTPEERDVVVANLRHFEGTKYLLHVAVAMPDHVHCLLTPLRRDADGMHSLASIRHGSKSFTAHKVNDLRGRSGPVWQAEGHDRIIRSDRHYQAAARYTIWNPVKAELARVPDDYRWLFYQQVQ